MSDQINVTGKVDVKIQLPPFGSNDLLKLGETMDMSDVEDRAFWHNVPGDRYGGPQGPPIDIQYLGSILVIRFELSRWDPTVFDDLVKRAVVTTKGTFALTDVGTLMLGEKGIRLLLASTIRPRNFPCCIVREPVGYAMGTKFSSIAMQFEAHRCPSGNREGILWDETVTEYAS